MEKSCDMSNNNTTSSSHAMPAHRTMFVKPGMSTHYSSSTNIDKRYKSIPTCHYCGIIGHTRPNCFKKCSQKPWDKKHVLKENEPGIRNQINNLCDQVKLISEKLENPTLFNKNSVMAKKEKDVSKHAWVKKSDNLCLVAHTALKVLDTYLWYLDSACSKHMTGDMGLLKDIQMARGGRITFGDGSQAKVIGNGQINIPGLEVSQKALYVEGLKANLLSISQLCDDDLVVQFSKNECNIFDSNGKGLMGGERTSDNCYGIPNLSSDSQIICNKATIDESELWHQRLGHLNFTNMFKIASKEVVKDLPKMKDTGKGVCGPCHLGKQTRTAHKKTSGILTSSNLELLHMDLMGPTRTSSLGGKKYILVIVDDYSRYNWVLLLREKSDAFEAA